MVDILAPCLPMLQSLEADDDATKSRQLVSTDDAALCTPRQRSDDPVMPAVRYPELYLCVDGGGTAVKVAISSKLNKGAVLARALGGPCNV